jgi:hypothetical protein
MQHRSCKSGALQEPAAQPPRQIGCTVGKASALEGGSGHVSWWIQSVQPSREGEILKQCEVVVEKRLMGKKPNMASDATGSFIERFTENADVA